MYESLISRRTILLRMSEKTSVGVKTVKLSEDTRVIYNLRTSRTIIDIIREHAEKNGGRALIPFNWIASLESMRFSGRFTLYVDDEKRVYLQGRIHAIGDHYRRGMVSSAGYTTPRGILDRKATRWVEVDQITTGVGFPLRDYILCTQEWDDDPRPLNEVIAGSRTSCMFITRKRVES